MAEVSKRKQYEVWSRRFIREMGVVDTMQEWADLIVENGENLGFCEQFNLPAYNAAKAAIKENVERIERCLATTSSASTAKETAESTPSTSTESAPPLATE